MRFENPDGESFSMELVGYQFPDVLDSEYDSNWLMVKITAISKDGNWTATEPCLLTWEVEQLIKWLEHMSVNREPGQQINFIEPCLSLALVEAHDQIAIRIFFELEVRPPWNSARTSGLQDLWLDFPLQALDLEDACRSLKGQLSRYPRRAIGAS